MIVKIICILVLLLCIFCPIHFCEKIANGVLVACNSFKFKILESLFGPLITEGEKLLNFSLFLDQKQSQKSNIFAYPRYKYFTKLMERILKITKIYGVSWHLAGETFRNILASDLKWERKIQQEFKSGLFQVFCLVFFIWIFIIMSQKSLPEYNDMTKFKTFILVYQLMGLFIYVKMANHLRFNIFKSFEGLAFSVQTLRSLLVVGINFKKLIELSKFAELNQKFKNPLAHIFERLELSVKFWKEQGISPKEELDRLLLELSFAQEIILGQLAQKLMVLKFFVMSIFFLGSYLLYLFKFIREISG